MAKSEIHPSVTEPEEEAYLGEGSPKPKKNKKKKNKKKSKKKSSKAASVSTVNVQSPLELEQGRNRLSNYSPKIVNRKIEQEAENSLPPHVTSWEIIPNILTNGATQLLVFYVNGKAVTHVEITLENMEELLEALNSTIIVDTDAEVTGWSIREPENPELPPIFSLISHGAVIGTMPLSMDVAKDIVPKFLKIYNPHKPTFERLLIWIFKHKILASIIAVGLLVLVIYPFISGIVFST